MQKIGNVYSVIVTSTYHKN